MLCTFAPGGISAIRQIRGAGVTTPLILDASFDGTYWLGAVPNENNTYVMSTGAITPGQNHDPEQNAVLAAYNAATHKPAVYGVGLFTGYSAIQALAKGITDAKSINSSAVQAALEQFRDVPLAIGKVTWTAQCHVPLGEPMDVLRIENGQEKLVATVTATHVSRAVC
jgi:branched-chain amino acid transport system substrate-binding protein